MDVILLQKVANLGGIGDRVKVKSGYGRNYLLPSGRATLATAANVARFEARRAELEKLAGEELRSAQQRAESLKDFRLTITAKAGTEGKLFGSVGTNDIAEGCTAAGHKVSRSEVRLPNGPIRAVGEHQVTVHLHTDVEVTLTVIIVAEEPGWAAEPGHGRAPHMAGPLRSRRDVEASDPGSVTPPHSIEAEQAVLGGLLIDALAWDQVGDLIVGDDFYRPDHRLIFAALTELIANGKPADVVTASEQLARAGQLESAGGLNYLGSLARDTPTAANVRAYAQIIRERSLLRRLISAGRAITAAAYANDGRAARDLVDEAEQQVFAIAEQSTGRRDGAVKVSALLPVLIDKIDEWHTNPSAMRGLPTGFTDFDRKTGGLRPGDLVIVAGRPSMGKTTLAMNIAEYAAVNPGTRSAVAIFSMEMPSEQLLTRMLSSIGGVQLNAIRSGQISDEDWVRVTAATSQLAEARIYIDESAGLTPVELRARARRVAREEKGLGLIIIDYLQLMQVPGTKENRATEIAEISRGLKALAKELQVPVIALSQLNRGVEQRTEKKPVMSDLRESGAIEQDADMILLIYREEVYDKNTPKRGVAEIDLAKHRNGEIGTFLLTFQGQYSRFANYAPDSYSEGVLR